MYDAVLALKSPGTERRVQPLRRHRKRHASDVIVYRKDDSDGAADGGTGRVNETVDIVPLDPENRIRVNLTIASDDSVGSPVYTVSLSLPGGAAQQQPEPEIARPPEAPKGMMAVAPWPSQGATECECYCPCLDDDLNTAADDVMFSTSSPPSTSTDVGYNDTSSTEFWSTYPSSSSEEPETAEVFTCPPPVLLFCEPGKLYRRTRLAFSGHDCDGEDNDETFGDNP